MDEKSSSYDLAVEYQHRLFGDKWVPHRTDPEDPDNAQEVLRGFIRHGYGESWARPGLDLRAKSLVTIAMLSAIGAEREVKLHIQAAERLGVSRSELFELFNHIACYLGTPKGMLGIRLAREVWHEASDKGGTS